MQLLELVVAQLVPWTNSEKTDRLMQPSSSPRASIVVIGSVVLIAVELFP